MGGMALVRRGQIITSLRHLQATLCKPHLHCDLVSTCVVAAHCSIFSFVPPGLLIY